jgi:hypothetical protein
MPINPQTGTDVYYAPGMLRMLPTHRWASAFSPVYWGISSHQHHKWRRQLRHEPQSIRISQGALRIQQHIHREVALCL